MAKVGRPTKLNADLIDQAETYLKDTSSVGINTLLPTIEGLAIRLGITRETLYAWEEDKPEFSDILGRLRTAQAEKIMQNSMLNRYNPTISKLMLSKHGYIEQRQEDITSGGEKLGTTLTPEQAEQLIKARSGR